MAHPAKASSVVFLGSLAVAGALVAPFLYAATDFASRDGGAHAGGAMIGACVLATPIAAALVFPIAAGLCKPGETLRFIVTVIALLAATSVVCGVTLFAVFGGSIDQIPREIRLLGTLSLLFFIASVPLVLPWAPVWLRVVRGKRQGAA